jgi:methionyl-tRNA formyltransferase
MTEKYKVVFFGTPDFAARGLASLLDLSFVEIGLVITQPDKPAGRGGKIQASPVKTLSEEKQIALYQPTSLKKELADSIDVIKKYGPFDLGIVIAFGQILPQAILDLPRMGCVNVHASLLPRWRGAAPIQRSIINGDSETGICLMKMDAGLDTGAVYSKDSTLIKSDDNFQTLHDRLAEMGGNLLKKDVLKILKGELPALAQPESGTTYAAKITQEEAKINWELPAQQLHNLIRGLSPVPGAYCFLEGKRLKLFQCRLLDKIGEGVPLGQVCFADKSRIEVSCRDGVLSIEELQLEGKRRMPVNEFLKGVKINTETRFT